MFSSLNSKSERVSLEESSTEVNGKDIKKSSNDVKSINDVKGLRTTTAMRRIIQERDSQVFTYRGLQREAK